MKKFLLIFTALCCACVAMLAKGVQIGELYYTLDTLNRTATVTCERWKDIHNYEHLTELDIPASVTYQDSLYAVTAIDTCAFAWARITSATIPYGITTIEERAFEGCTDLVTLTVPVTVTYIAKNAFHHCAKLTTVIVPNDLAIHRIPTTETPMASLKQDKKPERMPSIKGTEIIYGTNETTARRTSQKSCNFNGKIIVDVVRSAIIRSRR